MRSSPATGAAGLLQRAERGATVSELSFITIRVMRRNAAPRAGLVRLNWKRKIAGYMRGLERIDADLATVLDDLAAGRSGQITRSLS